MNRIETIRFSISHVVMNFTHKLLRYLSKIRQQIFLFNQRMIEQKIKISNSIYTDTKKMSSFHESQVKSEMHEFWLSKKLSTEIDGKFG